MITDADVERIPGATVYGSDGEKIGKAGAVYRDDQSGRPDWMTVQTGLFGTSESFVPLADANLDGDDVRVPYDKSRVKDAPRVDSEGHLDISEEDRLFEHYGMGGSGHAAAGQGHRDDARDDRRDVMDERRDDRRDVMDEQRDEGRDEQHDQRVREAAASAAPTGGRHEGTRELDLDRDDESRRDDATATGGRHEGLRDSGDSGLWRSSHDTHRAERSGDDRDGDRFGAGDEGDRSSAAAPAAGAAVGMGGLAAGAAASQSDDRRDDRSDTRAESRADERADDRRGEQRGDHRLNPVDLRDGSREGRRDDADRGRTTERSGLSSSPVSGAAAGAAGGAATSQRKPRLSQWVLVERTAIIEISDEEAQRLTGDASGTTDLRSTETRADR